MDTMTEHMPPPEQARRTAAFNSAAALGVFQQAGTLKQSSMLWGAVQVTDINATIKGSTVQTNLEAMVAGTQGTTMEASAKTFKDTIMAHPELRNGAEAMFRDEGDATISAFQQMMTGEGAIDMNQFADMMKNPAYRKMVGQTFQQVGTNKYGMNDAIEFTRRAQNALKDPNDPKKQNEFLQHAEGMGVDTSGLKTQVTMDKLKEFFQNPEKFIHEMVKSMNLPPEYANMLTSFMSVTAKFAIDTGQYYWNGQNGQPGLRQIGGQIAENMQNHGDEIRQRYGNSSPTSPTPMMQ
jgi:hypothetical protein